MSLSIASALSCAVVFSGLSGAWKTEVSDIQAKTQIHISASNVKPKLPPAPRWRQLDIAENLSQLIRANAPHYWHHARTQAHRYKSLTPYLQHHGIIAGDAHIGNFIIIPMIGKDGKTRLRYANFDLDDAGRGPFALDFAKLAIASKAVTKEVSYKDMVESYLKGLQGRRHEVPDAIKEITDWNDLADYRSHLREYVDERVDNNRFIIEGRVKKYNGKYTRAQIQELFPDMKVLDLARREKEFGGSLEAERSWVLVKDKKGELRIFELKEWLESSMIHWGPQPNRAQWLQEVLSVFDAESGGRNFRMHVMPDGRPFWIREKKYTLMDIPLEVDSFKEADRVSYLADYAAYHLGRWHGLQASSKPFIELLRKNPDAFREAIKEWSKDYLELAESQLH